MTNNELLSAIASMMNKNTKALEHRMDSNIKKCLRHFNPLAPIHGGIRGFLFLSFSCIIVL